MYASQCKNIQNNSGIPIENFDPGPGLSQYVKRNETENSSNTYSDINEEEHTQTAAPINTCVQSNNNCACTSNNNIPVKKGFLGLQTDDLLIIFLIFLLISDSEQNNDMLIPILLATLLIF